MKSDLTPEEQKAIDSVINQPDDVLLEILGRFETHESAAHGAAPPDTDELLRMGQERLGRWRTTFCQQLRANAVLKSVCSHEDIASLLEKVVAVFVAIRGPHPLELAVCSVLAARQGFIVFCKDVEYIEATDRSAD